MSPCRQNRSSQGIVARDEIIGEGSFKRVYKGRYTEGKRKGQPQATKELILNTPYTSTVFDHDIEVSRRSAEILEAWNDSGFINKRIVINIPEVWVYTRESRIPGVTHLVEPFIENFEKFNSNTGWVPDEQRRWTELMQALSHFSYHFTRRTAVMCDLQGAIYKNCAVLTDPAIHSIDRRYGPTDMGAKGISTFFHHHKCNEFCKAHWRHPRTTSPEFPRRYGTSMVSSDGALLAPSRETAPNAPCVPNTAGACAHGDTSATRLMAGTWSGADERHGDLGVFVKSCGFRGVKWWCSRARGMCACSAALTREGSVGGPTCHMHGASPAQRGGTELRQSFGDTYMGRGVPWGDQGGSVHEERVVAAEGTVVVEPGQEWLSFDSGANVSVHARSVATMCTADTVSVSVGPLRT